MRAPATLLLLLGAAAMRCNARVFGDLNFGSNFNYYQPQPQIQHDGGWPNPGWQSPWSNGGGARWRPEGRQRPSAAPVPGEDQPVLWPHEPPPSHPPSRPPGPRRRPSDPITVGGRPRPRPSRPASSARPTPATARPAASGPAASGPAASGPCGKVALNRIIYGKNATRGQFPWQAGLIYSKGGQRSVLCGGALIAPSYVLTAAHCLSPRDLRGWKLEGVRLGALLASVGVQEPEALDVGVAQQLPHQQYTQDGVRNVRNANDIALLRLDRPAPYTDFIRPVCLPEGNQRNSARVSSEPQTYLVAGWGYTEDLVFSPNLKVASLVPEDPEDCGRKLQGVTIPSYQFCAKGRNKEDSCNGDSGGPLIAASERPNTGDVVFQVEGIVSYGQRNCLEGNPGAYTRVASYLDWIQQTMQQ